MTDYIIITHTSTNGSTTDEVLPVDTPAQVAAAYAAMRAADVEEAPVYRGEGVDCITTGLVLLAL